MKYNTVIFDLDGTLLDTLEDLYDSVNHTLQRYGFPLRSLDEVRSFVGNGVEKLMRLSLPNVDEATFYDIFATFKAYYLTHNTVHTKPYVGIMQLLDQLKRLGMKMAIVSNKYHEAVQQICLPLFGSYIEVMLGEQSLIRKKPAPDMVNRALLMLGSDPEHTIYIGDSEVDIQTAHAARTICIGAAWGFRGAPFLKQQGAQYIALSPQDVMPIVHQLNGVVANEKEGTI